MEPNQQEPILEIKNLNSFYRQGGGAFSKGRIIQVLRNVNVTIGRGERFCQGILVPFGLAEEEDVAGVRSGGFGSTGA